MSYRTSRSSGYGYECPTELTEVLCRVIPGVNTPGTVCTYPTEHNLEILLSRGDSNQHHGLCKGLESPAAPQRAHTKSYLLHNVMLVECQYIW